MPSTACLTLYLFVPLPFYLSCLAILILGWIAWNARREAWGLPACMVLATVTVWYVGDVLYNEFDVYLETIGVESITSAWWQVLWFLLCFGTMVVPVHRLMNSGLRGQRSHVINYLESNRLRREDVQQRVDLLGRALLAVWLLLMGIALVQVRGDVIGLFAPYLGQKADPWARGQIGGGFSAFISLAAYLQIFLAAAFGVLAAVAYNPRTRAMALSVCFLTLPYFILDRTRNTMLATVLPGVLAYVFLRLRFGFFAKLGILLAAFLLVNFWFKVVIENRAGMSFDIKSAVSGGGGEGSAKKGHHEGLNMLEELAWVDHFMVTGSYLPNNGQRYFAELVNPIPRALWKNKPMIGLDYAVARGQAVVGPSGETTSTVSTGMIGQGVVNFGRIGGPLAAAFLMSLWVAMLARQDLLSGDPGRLLLYGSGLILTFNMGRDITLLVLYPFFFGMIMYKMWQLHKKNKVSTGKAMPPNGRPKTGVRGRLAESKARSVQSAELIRNAPER